MKRKMGIKSLIIALFVMASGITFAQTLTPKKANQKMKTQGFFILKDEYKTTEFLANVKGVRLVNNELVVREGLMIIHAKNADIVINTVKCVTVDQVDGSSITRSCGCEGGGGSCNLDHASTNSYTCPGDDCCSLVTVTVSKDGEIDVDR